MMQIVIRALVVAATTMINVRLASLVSLVAVVTPTVLDGCTTPDELEIAVIVDVTFSIYTLVVLVLFTTGGVEVDGTAVAEVISLLVGVAEVDNSLLVTLLEDDDLTSLSVIVVAI